MWNSREIIFGEVLMAHVRDELIDPKTLYIDQLGLDAIGRMGGMGMRAHAIILICRHARCRRGRRRRGWQAVLAAE
jgi:hypothetical protein